MPTIPDMIRSGRGEFSSSALLRDGVEASGPVLFSEDRLAAADRIEALEAELLATQRERDDLRSFCKGIAVNITNMLRPVG